MKKIFLAFLVLSLGLLSFASGVLVHAVGYGSGTFHAISTTADGAKSVYAADLDNDGDLDILSASSLDNSITWYMNIFGNDFVKQPAISTSADGVSFVFAADLDNDGDMDVLSASYDSDSICWYKNNGDLTFTEQILISSTADGAFSVFAADLNNDGLLDVLSASSLDNKVAWYLNNGDLTFTEQIALSTTADGASSVFSVDLDNDGLKDVISSSYNSDTITWYKNNGDLTFTEQTVISTTADGATSVFASDLNNDGKMDVLSSSYEDDTITWYKNNGDLTFTEQAAISTTADGASSVYTSDLDNDGKMDVLSTSSLDDTVDWYQNNGDLTFTEQTPISSTSDGASSVYACDLDNDGDIDILSASYLDDTIAWFMSNQSIRFAEQPKIASNADNVYSAIASDLDNDGDLDIISASQYNDTIAWYKNNGDGTYTEQTPLSTTSDGVRSVFAADLDNDGDMDVLSASAKGNTVAWYINNGDSTFTEQTPISTIANGASSVYAAYIDDDEYLDVISANTGNDRIIWYKNNGGTSFTEQTPISTTSDAAFCVHAADLDNDGIQDIVATSYLDNTVAWFKNDGHGNFSAAHVISSTSLGAKSVFAADLDNDEYLDIITGSFDEDKVSWYKNDGHGNFTFQQDISTTVDAVHSVFAADMDNDGDMDVLSAGYFDDTVVWYKNNGTGIFIEQQPLSTNIGAAMSAYAADMDNDGDLDVLATGNSDDSVYLFTNNLVNSYPEITFKANGGVVESIYQMNNNASFVIKPSISTTAFGATAVFSADLDNDGDMDVLSANFNSDTISWYMNDGNGVFTPQTDISTTLDGTRSVIAADLDNDGDMDVLASGFSNDTIAWYKNDGIGNFTLQPTISTTADGTENVCAADLDNDGLLDVISANAYNNSISWYKNNGDSTFTVQTPITTTAFAARYVNAADMDNDGDIDIVAAVYYENQIVWYMNNGDSTFTEQASLSTDAQGAICVEIADFNNDGYQDVVAAAYNTNYISWYLNNGNGTFTEQLILAVGVIGTFHVAVADMDNDGFIDILIANRSPKYNSWFKNNGDGTFTEQANITTGIESRCNFPVDLDNDGDIDVISASFYLNKVQMFENTLTNSLVVPTVPTKTGYTFAEWYSDEALTTLYNFDATVWSDFTLYADWSINQYSVEYVDWNDTVLQTADYDYNSDLSLVSAPVEPSRTGYSFTSWSALLPTNLPANDITITATYSINQYTMTFNSNGGSLVSSITDDYNQVVLEPISPTKTGYTFDKWYIDALLTTEYVFTTMPAENITLYAGYTINQYTISFETDGGSATSSITNDYGAVVVSPSDPTKTGYTFDKWYSDSLLTTEYVFTTIPAENITLYSGYTPNQYTISFITNGGSAVAFIMDVFGHIVSEPIAPIKTGYTFDKWYIDALLTTEYVFTTIPSEDTTLYAGYTINQYTLSYVNWNGAVLQTADYDYNSDLSFVVAPANPSKIGYSFASWNGLLPTNMPDNDITITAAYTVNQYTISFNSNGGSAVAAITSDFGQVISEPIAPMKAAYTFDKWYTDALLTSEYVFTTMPSDNITLYAGYTVNQYTLQYLNWNGMVLQTAEYAYNAELSFVTPPASPTITGYTFVRWNTILPANMPANTLSITPIFAINQYSLEYYNYDGSLLETIEVDYNTDLTFFTGPDTPIKTGYSFVGWDILLPSNMPASNVAITAMYTINQYTLAYVDSDGTVLQASVHYYNSDLSSVSAPLDPSRTGYTFSGWSNNLPLFMSSSDLTITAIYTINQYELEYRDWDGLVIKSSLYDYNLNSMYISVPENPIRIGYTFTGWDITLPKNMPASSVKLTATYKVNKYSVTYLDWNIAILKSQSFDYDSDISSGIAPNDPVREGYTFTGWDITLPENMPSSNLTISATYKINQYTINYVDWNGLVIYTEIVDYNVELPRILDLSDPFRTGYTFTGWNNLLPENMPANNITITPVYSINQYSIVFMDYNGSILQTSKYYYNEDLSSLIPAEVQVRPGLTFVSWNPAIPDKMPAATLVLRATYTDTEVPVISDLEDQNVHLSQVLSFVFPVPIVSDNIDTTPVVEITYYKADGVTILNDIFEAFVELQNGHNIYAVYTARDGSNNESNEVKVVICVIDDINPVVSGVQDSTVYKAGEVLNISFNEGNATLNGNTFVNGSSVDKVGDYTLEVIDEAGNSTTVSFEIKASNQLMLFAIIGLLETLVFLSIYYYVNKEY